MAVNIDDLQVQTETAQPASSAKPSRSTPSRPLNFKVELEKLEERELRLHAD